MIEALAWALCIALFALLCVCAALGVYNLNAKRKQLAKVTQIVDMTVEVETLRYKAALADLTKEDDGR